MVKGVAEKTVVSDLAAFTASIAATGKSRTEGYAAAEKAKMLLLAKLNKLGFTSSMQGDETVSCDEMHRTEKIKENGKEITKSYIDHYKVTYSVRICTSDVNLVARNVLKIHELSMYKYEVTVSRPGYFINNPEQYKLELVDSASASAAARASVVARQSGCRLGELIEAKQGVIQITAPASNETSDYGVYDTNSVQKVIRLVMTMKFALK